MTQSTSPTQQILKKAPPRRSAQTTLYTDVEDEDGVSKRPNSSNVGSGQL
ncbi:hypothetical protein AA0118_g4679 [Alternaria tenuissima]|uniref:Uncharacterized protein n=1 Tax=Alternaria tenuissima TaxID=119927 RepID=A0AB37W4K8_9PLEO|nr:hypothetical protein AA0115_g11101 [Alternaria tenuissima]RYN63294.1 hypothetical protein AA0118_g4679 [Alternaria tenuissima]